MPSRLIKDSIHASESVNKMTDFQFRLWVNLITYVDDYGRGDARPAVIRGTCFPLRERMTNKDIDAALEALAGIGCISLYTVDGRPYLYFPTWESHQNVRNKKSKYPAPEDGNKQLQTIENNCKQLNTNVPVIQSNPILSESESISESVSESSLLPDAEGEDCPTEGKSAPKKPKKPDDPGFVRFWEAYPCKVAKQDAIKAWKKINPSSELVDEIVSGVEKWKKSDQWTRDGGRYVPYPATFLNGQRWAEAPEQSPSPLPWENKTTQTPVKGAYYNQPSPSSGDDGFDFEAAMRKKAADVLAKYANKDKG